MSSYLLDTTLGYGNQTALAKLSPGETVLDLGSGGSGGSTIGPPEVMRGQLVKIEPVTPRITSKPALIRLGRRHEYLPPENLLIKWRSHAGCGFNLSTMCLL